MKKVFKIRLRTVTDRLSDNEMKNVIGRDGYGDDGNGSYSDFIKFTCYCVSYEQYPFVVYARTLTAALEHANSDCHGYSAKCA